MLLHILLINYIILIYKINLSKLCVIKKNINHWPMALDIFMVDRIHFRQDDEIKSTNR